MTRPEEVTALQAIRLNAVAAANTYLGAGLRSLTNTDPARLLALAETIAAFIVDGTIPPPSCTCARVEIGTPGSGETTLGSPRGCAIHDPSLAKERADA